MPDPSFYSSVLDHLAASKVLVHVTCSGAGTQVVRELWERPGASAWLSGATFPYAREETEEFLGFKPGGVDHDAAVDLALEAYGRAYRYGGSAVGLSLTASVASSRVHRGDHRVHAAVVTDEGAWSTDLVLRKGVGPEDRRTDDAVCTDVAMGLLGAALGLDGGDFEQRPLLQEELLDRVLARPVFTRERTRTASLPWNAALMPGAYDPPHEGHLGVAGLVEARSWRVVHHVTVDPPHKAALTAQQAVGRARMLRGRDVVFTRGDALYVDKARAHPGKPLVVGADALDRMLDPGWGLPTRAVVDEFRRLGTKVFVVDRVVGELIVRCQDVLGRRGLAGGAGVFEVVEGGVWADSSSAIRAARA